MKFKELPPLSPTADIREVVQRAEIRLTELACHRFALERLERLREEQEERMKYNEA